MSAVPVTALPHSADRPSMSLYCLTPFSNTVESDITHFPAVHPLLFLLRRVAVALHLRYCASRLGNPSFNSLPL
jgi:hypothetical protein